MWFYHFFIRYSISNIDPRKQLPILSTLFKYLFCPLALITFFSSISVSKVSILAELQSPDTVHTLQQQTLGTSSRVAESGHGAHPATTNIGNQFNYRSHASDRKGLGGFRCIRLMTL